MYFALPIVVGEQETHREEKVALGALGGRRVATRLAPYRCVHVRTVRIGTSCLSAPSFLVRKSRVSQSDHDCSAVVFERRGPPSREEAAGKACEMACPLADALVARRSEGHALALYRGGRCGGRRRRSRRCTDSRRATQLNENDSGFPSRSAADHSSAPAFCHDVDLAALPPVIGRRHNGHLRSQVLFRWRERDLVRRPVLQVAQVAAVVHFG
jgi:hypothetical protein